MPIDSLATPAPDKVHIFDTTLRDGEQAPGCSMTMTEKLRMAHKLAELGVDIMEAGFPIASTGDFEAVQKVSREVSVKVAALARATALDVEQAAIVSVHCHNELGLAVANSLSAIQNGARQVECTVNGIGERAGNCSLEEIVMVLKTRGDKLPYTTGIKTEQLFPASQLLTEI